MGLVNKIKDLMPEPQQGYECADCDIGFIGRKECPACGQTETVSPTE